MTSEYFIRRQKDWNRQAVKHPNKAYSCVASDEGWKQLDTAAHVELFARHKASGRAALDFGAGIGRIALPMLGRFERVVCVDTCSNALEETRRNAEIMSVQDRVELIGFPGQNHLIDVPDGSIDLVFTCMCMQHVSMRSARLEIYNEFARVMNENAACSIQLHASSVSDHINTSCTDWAFPLDYDDAMLENELAGSGLRIEGHRSETIGGEHGTWIFVDCVSV